MIYLEEEQKECIHYEQNTVYCTRYMNKIARQWAPLKSMQWLLLFYYL